MQRPRGSRARIARYKHRSLAFLPPPQPPVRLPPEVGAGGGGQRCRRGASLPRPHRDFLRALGSLWTGGTAPILPPSPRRPLRPSPEAARLASELPRGNGEVAELGAREGPGGPVPTRSLAGTKGDSPLHRLLLRCPAAGQAGWLLSSQLLSWQGSPVLLGHGRGPQRPGRGPGVVEMARAPRKRGFHYLR